jgi:thymidylate synthase
MGVRWEEQYRELLRDLRDRGDLIKPRKGNAREIISKHFSIEDPRDRCILNPVRSFNIFQVVGHWLWIMAGKMDLSSINYYNPVASRFSADLRKLDGAYGPRLFGLGVMNQIPSIVQLIRAHPDTRRGVATVYIPEFDSSRTTVEGREDEVPCTIALQFLPREGRLHALAYMRSQDAFLVLPYDVFIFTMLQEYVARSTDLKLGEYHHIAGSFHYYIREEKRLDEMLSTATAPGPLMEAMPSGDQSDYLKLVHEVEERARIEALAWTKVPGQKELNPRSYFEESETLPPFWRDVVLALVASAGQKLRSEKILMRVHERAGPALRLYVERELSRLPGRPPLEKFGE